VLRALHHACGKAPGSRVASSGRCLGEHRDQPRRLLGGVAASGRAAKLPLRECRCKSTLSRLLGEPGADLTRFLPSAGARLFAIAALVATAPPAAARDAVDLDALIGGFAKMPGLAARFREEKHIALLKAPLTNEGTLYFAPPDLLVRHVERPAPSTLLLRGDELVMGTAADSQTIDLANQPAVRAFVDAFRLVLAGDLAGLRTLYAIEVRSGAEPGAWRLVLMPRDERLAGVVRVIELAGREALLAELTVREPDGDFTVTRFRDVDPQRRFTPEERDALFRLAP
jgi:hypothetical protein